MATTKLENKVQKLEGLVMANRFGAKTIWGGFMTTVVATLLFIVVMLPAAFWAVGFAEKQSDGSIALVAGGAAAVMVMIAVLVAYYVAMVVGLVRILMGFYRMAHPEKYVDRVTGEE